MSNIVEINKQTQALKERFKGIDSSGRLIYETFVFMPDTGREYQRYYNGNNQKGSVYERFCQEIDSIMQNSSVARLKVVLKNGRKDLGETEIIINNYARNFAPILQPIETNNKPAATPPPEMKDQTIGSSQFVEILGQAFLGKGGLGSIHAELGDTGMLLKAQEHTLQQRFLQEKQTEKLAELQKQNGILEQKIATLEIECKRLQDLNDKYEEKIDDLEDELKEYERINPRRDMVSGLAGEILAGAAITALKKTPFAGLLGISDDTTEHAPQYQQQGQANYQAPQPVVVQTGDEYDLEPENNE